VLAQCSGWAGGVVSLCPPPELGQATLTNLGNAHRSGSRVGRPAGMALVAALSSTQQQQPVSNQCSPLAPVTGSTHTHTHTPSAMDIGRPQAKPAPGWSLLACRGRSTLCPPLPPPPNKQQHDKILTHRFQHRESSRCHRRSSQQQLCHLPISLFCPPSFPLARSKVAKEKRCAICFGHW
jgi:hypothetical protein